MKKCTQNPIDFPSQNINLLYGNLQILTANKRDARSVNMFAREKHRENGGGEENRRYVQTGDKSTTSHRISVPGKGVRIREKRHASVPSSRKMNRFESVQVRSGDSVENLMTHEQITFISAHSKILIVSQLYLYSNRSINRREVCVI